MILACLSAPVKPVGRFSFLNVPSQEARCDRKCGKGIEKLKVGLVKQLDVRNDDAVRRLLEEQRSDSYRVMLPTQNLYCSSS